jgi:hypothetical protein
VEYETGKDTERRIGDEGLLSLKRNMVANK